MYIEIFNTPLHLLNIYAPADSNHKDRDDFFRETTYYLRNSIDNSIIGGDFNCIISPRDSSSSSTHNSKALNEIVKNLSLKDVWWFHNNNVEYTYVRQDYGSRLDRFYVKCLENQIVNVFLKHTNLSDHSCFIFNMNVSMFQKIGNYYWKLNIFFT